MVNRDIGNQSHPAAIRAFDAVYEDGEIVCGCFNPILNKRAPTEIEPGIGPRALPRARELMSSGATIPVFLKRGPGEWIFQGLFRAVRLLEEEADIRRHDRRVDAVAVLFLEKVRFRPTEKIFAPD